MAFLRSGVGSGGSGDKFQAIIPNNYNLVGGENVSTRILTRSGAMSNETVTCTEDYDSYDYIIFTFARHTSYQSDKAIMIIPMDDFLSGKTFSITTNYSGGNHTRNFYTGNQKNTVVFTTSNQYTNVPLAIDVV